MRKREKYDKKKQEKKCTKKTKIVMPIARFEVTPLNNVLKQNFNVTKPARFATYIRHISIADNLCLLQ